MKKILIADDNLQICSILEVYAKKEGYAPYIAKDGEEAMALFGKHSFEIILLDVMMPEKDGFEVCREIRKTSNVPIIMITARGEDYEQIMGLDMGADDYVVKPFSPAEVMARVRAVLRRLEHTEASAKDRLIFDDLEVNLGTYSVSLKGKPVSLTKKEFELLWILASNKEKVFTRENLLDSIWGYDYYGDIRTVDSHIKRLRAKLGSVPHENWSIKTIWGVGYKFETDNEKK